MQGEALAGLVYLELLPLTELASLIDARLCLRPGIQDISSNLRIIMTCAVHAYLNLGRHS